MLKRLRVIRAFVAIHFFGHVFAEMTEDTKVFSYFVETEISLKSTVNVYKNVPDKTRRLKRLDNIFLYLTVCP